MSVHFEELSRATVNLWAKKRTVDDQQSWLPLLAHLQDCANVIDQLNKLWLSDNQRQLLTETMSDEDLRKLLKFIALTHDIGKATAAFQRKESYDGNHDIDEILIERLIRTGFAQLDHAKIANAAKSPHALAGEALLERSGVPESVGAIIGGHHGRTSAYPPRDDILQFTANYWQDDKDKKLQKPWQYVQDQLIAYALTEAGYSSVDEIPAVTRLQSVLIEGLLITADWLSSSEYLNDDPAKPLFPLISLDESITDLDMTSRFQNAWLTWSTSEGWRPERVSLATDPYQERWQFSARPVQKAVTEAIDAMEKPGIAIIEAPMGVGKTEMALVAGEQLANKTGCDGLFFGLPTQATTNAMFGRVKTWLMRQADHQDGRLSIELLHSKAQFNDAFKQVPLASAVAEDEPEQSGVVVNEWFSGKKSILANFTVGTIDNLLQLALKQKHLTLRHLGFSSKVVCIDEVHAYDAYVLVYLDRALEWLGAYHVPVVILSATLPKQRRNELLGAYYRGRFGRVLETDGDFASVGANWQDSEAYPLVTMMDDHTVRQVTDFPGVSDQTSLEVKITRVADSPEELMQRISRTIQAGGVAGVIVNTVKRAQALAQLVPEGMPSMVLHSSFLAPDRAAIEEALEAKIGKNGTRPERLIVIGTQVLEQSLDIDFGVLFTDIAPMDLLLQRAGRLHRHHRERPQALQQPQLFVSGIEAPGDYGDSEWIYDAYLLMRTDAALGDTIRLPEDISPLVQGVYAFKDDPDLPGVADAKQAFFDKIAQKKKDATAYRLSRPKAKRRATLHGWQDGALPGVDTDDQRGIAAVRDIDESIEVILVQHTGEGYQLMDGRPLKEAGDRQVAMQVIRLPGTFSKVYTIDETISALEKQTTEHFRDWQTSRWLRGALALVLDANGDGELGANRLHYSPRLGLMYDGFTM